MNFPKWALKNPTMVILGTLFFTIWGLLNYKNLSRREDPEIKISVALVVTIYPGASAEKVEQQVTQKLENEIEQMDNIKEISSTTRENISVIFVSVRYEVDEKIEWLKLRSRMKELEGSLPQSVIGPQVWDDFGDTTGMIITLSGARPRVLLDTAEDLKDELNRAASVGRVDFYGKIPEVVYVEGSREKMAKYKITPIQMQRMLKMRNLKIPAGSIKTDKFGYRVQPTGAYSSIEEIENTILDISRETAHPVHVRDLFDVYRGPKNPPDTMVLKDGQTTLALGVVMQRGHNMVKMGKDVREILKGFRTRLPPGLHAEIVHDAPRQVNDRINSFMKNLLEGLAIVVLSMGVFLGIRSALISAVAIPLSVLIAMSLMPIMKIDLELVSISAFIVALGMLVDNSIIVTDNIDIKLRQGLNSHNAAWKGSYELARPVVAGTMATVVAFLPMLLLSDEMGSYVRSLPLVVAVSLIGSLIIAMTLTPYMAKKLLHPPKKKKQIATGPFFRGYRAFMRFCLRARWLIVLLTLALLGGSAYLYTIVGFSFFPDAHRDQFTVSIWTKEGTTLEETLRVAKQADEMLRTDKDVVSTLVHAGRGGPRFYITVVPEFQKSNYAQIMVNTSSPEVTHDVIERFNEKASHLFPGARVFAHKLVMGIPVEAPIAIRVLGPELSELKKISSKIQTILRSTPGAIHVRDNMGPDVPSFEVKVDEERANRVGITNTDVALAFLSTYQGFELTSFDDGDKEIPVVLRLKGEQRRIKEDLEGLPVFSNLTGNQVPLSNVAEIIPQWSAGVILRHNKRRSVSVLARNEGRLADDILKEVRPKLAGLDLPEGYSLEFAGEKKEMDKAFGELLVVFGLIIASLLGLLILQLGSLRKTLVVLFAVPLALIGAAVGLYLGKYSFSFMAFLGVVALAGMVIKNSVVWVEFVDRAEEEGKDQKESVIEAGVYRMRPIMLTTVTTVGGLIPLGLFGGVLFEPMAWAMIGGLTVSTLLILVVVPVLFTLMVPGPKKKVPMIDGNNTKRGETPSTHARHGVEYEGESGQDEVPQEEALNEEGGEDPREGNEELNDDQKESNEDSDKKNSTR